MRIVWFAALAVGLLVFSAPAAPAQTCGGTHVARAGETIYDIAESYYGDGRKWTIIYYANQDALRNDPSTVRRGVRLSIPCLREVGEDPDTPLQRDDAELKLLTGGNYAPFTGRDLPANGLITELVNAAFESSPAPVSFSLSWQDDWSQHLFPLLDRKRYDVGFPWLKPNCEENPRHRRCRNFHFSDPLFEMLVLLFVRADQPLRYERDEDLHGARLCRPDGYYTHDLDRAGRRWLSRDLITLVRGDSPADCFRRLERGEVDGVTLNEFLGRRMIQDLGLSGTVVAAEQPISIEGLHVIVSKTHARGTTFMYRFNAGLERLKRSDRYNQIVSRHLANHWEQINEPAPAPSKGGADHTDATGGSKNGERQGESGTAVAEGSASNDANGGKVGKATRPDEDQPAPAEVSAAQGCQALRTGYGHWQDKAYAKAVPYFHRALQVELPLAEYFYGLANLTGRGVPKNTATGVAMLKKAAADRNALSSYIVAQAYLSGDGVEKSVPEFLKFLLLADLSAEDTGSLRNRIDKTMEAVREKIDADTLRTARSGASKWQKANASRYPDCTKVASRGARGGDGGRGGDAQVAATPDPSDEVRPASNGTGFFVSERGHVMTNHHVIEACRRVRVNPLGDVPRDAVVVATSERDDLAILKLEAGEPRKVAHFRTDRDVSRGEPVFVFGFPLSGLLTSTGNLTDGIVSGLEGAGNNSSQFQMNAQIQPGNSGGPVVDEDGFVIGVVVSKLNEQFAMDKLKTGVQNVNFAVRGNVARNFLRANGVRIQRSADVSEDRSRGDAVRIIEEITARIECFK